MAIRWKSLPGKKPRRKAIYVEQPLHIGIVAKLRRDFPGLLFTHPYNGGKRTAKEAALAKALGQRAGMTDLLFWWPEYRGGLFTGRMDSGMIEIKTATGTLSEEQKAVRNQVHSYGGKWALCRDYGAVVDTLKAWGAIHA